MQRPATLELSEFVRNSRTICHEISHMWFGNLVTMRWWDDLWLNEGFARFIEHKCLDALHPEYQLNTIFLKDVFEPMLERDRSSSTHSVVTPILDPEEIDNIFDIISYGKGASLARMMEQLMGAEQFRDGIRKYLQVYQYKNATTDDLFHVLDDFTDPGVTQVMREWTLLVGHPAVTVTRSSATHVTIVQECDTNQNLWPIPLRYRTSTGAEGLTIMRTKTLQLDIGSATWVKVNLRHFVVMETCYEGSLLTALAQDISLLSKEDAYGLILDSFHFFKVGRVQFETLDVLLKAAARVFREVSFCRKIDAVLLCLEKNLDGVNLFKEKLEQISVATMQEFKQVPETDFYHLEMWATADVYLTRYRFEELTVQQVLAYFRDNCENFTPELTSHWAMIYGQYEDPENLSPNLPRDVLDLIYQHAGPKLIKGAIQKGQWTRLWNHANPGKALEQAISIVKETATSPDQLYSEGFADWVMKSLPKIESAIEFERVQTSLRELAMTEPQYGELTVYAETFKSEIDLNQINQAELLTSVGL